MELFQGVIFLIGGIYVFLGTLKFFLFVKTKEANAIFLSKYSKLLTVTSIIMILYGLFCIIKFNLK